MSSRPFSSLIDLRSLQKNKIEQLFSISQGILDGKEFDPIKPGQTGALLFFEASTRTRLSFETACARWGVHPLRFDGKIGTSLEKGETFEDTVLNVAAMSPAFLVIRCGDDLNLHDMQKKVSMPILNAGWGRRGHPTQALLDVLTMRQSFGNNLSGLKLLIIGDVRHSRVAASHLELAEILGYQVALCGPESFLPRDFKGPQFDNLAEGLRWADVAMALRVQSERHSEDHALGNYRDRYGLTQKSVQILSSKGLIMHPGPINQGTEMDTEVLRDPRCRMLQQVSNGVLIRQSLIYLAVQGGLV
jgi:aspartate carbamoyltransferase catalytic subunit